MKHSSIAIAVMLLAILFTIPAQADRIQASGKLTMFRVHDVGSKYGPPTDQIDVEVVIQLNTEPGKAFGFQLRNDSNRPARQGMLDLLRDAFNKNSTVTIDYDINPGKKNGVIIRAWLTNVEPPSTFQYAAKFACGKTSGDDGVAEGIYYTAINVHNPWSKKIEFKKKYAIARREPMQGQHTPFFDVELSEDQAQEIDCTEIFNRTENITTAVFRTGFVVLESGVELDVVAVYTAANMETGHVMTQHIEHIPPRRIVRELPDLLPVPDETGSFCRQRGDKLLVIIKNQGLGVADSSMTEVDFLDLGTVSYCTPPIAPGDSKELLFNTPPDFFNIIGRKEFHITADVLHWISETNEGNNKATGFCINIP